MCYGESDTLTHFLLNAEIKKLIENRKPILDKLYTVLRDILIEFPDAVKHSLLQLLVDCSVILQNCLEYIHTVTD